MALEPKDVTAAEEPNPELVDMSRRFWLSLVLSVPLFLLAMSDMLPGQPLEHWIGPAGAALACNSALATPVVLWGGWPFFERGWQSIVTSHPQHVHADRHRHRRGIRLTAWSRRLRRSGFPNRSAATADRSTCISNRRQ